MSNKHGVRKVRTPSELAAKRKQIELHKIKEYKAVVQEYLAFRDQEKHSREAFELTAKLLALNPEYFSVWNYRRRIMQHMDTEAVLPQELLFTQARLKEFPKVYWIWNHRRWCLEAQKSPDWHRELMLVEKMLSMDARNYHGWHYRRYVVAKLESSEQKSFVDSELEYTAAKINANFSNFSAWHNRSRLIPLHLEGKTEKERRDFLDSEIDYITQAAYTDPDDQSAWIYLRWLISSAQSVICPDLEVGDQVKLVNAQIASVQELYELEPESKWCCDTLVFLTGFLYEIEAKEMDDEARARMRELVNKLKDIDTMRSGRYDYLLATLS